VSPRVGIPGLTFEAPCLPDPRAAGCVITPEEWQELTDLRRSARWEQERRTREMGKRASPRQHFIVPNNPLGWLMVWALRRILNRKTYRLVIRSRGMRVTWRVRRAAERRRRDSLAFFTTRLLTFTSGPYADERAAQATLERLAQLREPLTDNRIRAQHHDRVPHALAARWGVYIERKASVRNFDY